jgi:hypothetical protein
MGPVGSRLTLRRGYVQTPARPGSASAADGDGVAAVALSGPGGDLRDRGSDLDLDVDRTTSEGIQQPGDLARRVCSGLPGQASPLLALDAAAAVRDRRADDRQYEAQLRAGGLAELGGLAHDPLAYR